MAKKLAKGKLDFEDLEQQLLQMAIVAAINLEPVRREMVDIRLGIRPIPRAVLDPLHCAGICLQHPLDQRHRGAMARMLEPQAQVRAGPRKALPA